MYYLQLAHRLNNGMALWKPYYRYESVNVDLTDGAFKETPTKSWTGLHGSTVGIRYDLSEFAALKMEYRRQKFTGISPANGGFVQLSFIF